MTNYNLAKKCEILLDCELFYVQLLMELNKSKTDVLYCDWFLIHSLIETSIASSV